MSHDFRTPAGVASSRPPTAPHATSPERKALPPPASPSWSRPPSQPSRPGSVPHALMGRGRAAAAHHERLAAARKGVATPPVPWAHAVGAAAGGAARVLAASASVGTLEHTLHVLASTRHLGHPYPAGAPISDNWM